MNSHASVVASVVIAIALATAGGSAVAASGNDSNAERYSDRLGELVNHYRSRHGKDALVADRALAALAREHSIAMAKAGRLSHDDYQSRFQRSGYGMCVENVGWNYPTPQAQLLAWQQSPGHDRNLLDPRIRQMGIGTASDYVTFIACRLRDAGAGIVSLGLV